MFMIVIVLSAEPTTVAPTVVPITGPPQVSIYGMYTSIPCVSRLRRYDCIIRISKESPRAQ